jgi:hypothetical protein
MDSAFVILHKVKKADLPIRIIDFSSVKKKNFITA